MGSPLTYLTDIFKYLFHLKIGIQAPISLKNMLRRNETACSTTLLNSSLCSLSVLSTKSTLAEFHYERIFSPFNYPWNLRWSVMLEFHPRELQSAFILILLNPHEAILIEDIWGVGPDHFHFWKLKRTTYIVTSGTCTHWKYIAQCFLYICIHP